MICPIQQQRMRRSLLLVIAMSLQICAATSSYHADQFPSSIITNNIDVQHSHNNIPSVNNYGIRLQRSFIDRDPIYYEENGLNSIAEEDVMFDEVIQHSSISLASTPKHGVMPPLY